MDTGAFVAVVRARTSNEATRRVAAALAAHADNSGHVTGTGSEVAAEAGVSTIRDACRQLESLGLFDGKARQLIVPEDELGRCDAATDLTEDEKAEILAELRGEPDAPSEPAEAPSVKQWTVALAACKDVRAVPYAARMLGAVIGQHADYSTGLVYLGSDKLSDVLSLSESKVFDRRRALRDAGWLTDTGERVRRAKVYRLTLPLCGCKSCSEPSPAEGGYVRGETSPGRK